MVRLVAKTMGYIAGAPWALAGILWSLLFLGGRQFRWADGTLQIRCKRIIPKMATAQTWAFVIFCRWDRWPLASRVLLDKHERKHVDDFHRLGVLVLSVLVGVYVFFGAWWLDIVLVTAVPAAYGLATLWAVMRGRNFYLDNEFEKRARRAAEEK